jgi:hypothetical protein
VPSRISIGLGLDKERHRDHDNQPSSVVTDSSDGKRRLQDDQPFSPSNVYSVFSFASLYHHSPDLLDLLKADEWIIAYGLRRYLRCGEGLSSAGQLRS